MTELAAGAEFAGHRIEALVGRGGMGVVYRATQLDLGRTVALKVVAPELLEDDRARRRFVRECRLAASLDHPHVIPIHYAGEEAGLPYLAMRYVAGDDGRRMVRREGRLAPERAARIVAQVAAALDAAHAAGLVHRDVKPANVLLGAGEHAYLTDFGLTRHVRSSSGATRDGRWVGTLDFVAPEQIRGGEIDARADVYALGCLLYFLLTAGVPYPQDGDEAKLWAHLTQPPPRVSATAPEAAAFDAVIRRALAKSPDDRYPSAGDLGRAAVAAAVGADVAEPERSVARGAAAAFEGSTVTRRAPRSPPRRHRLTLAIAGTAGLVGATAVVLVLALSDGSPERNAADRPGGAETGRVLASVRWGSRPNALATTRDRVWAGAWRTERLAAIDPDANRRLRRLRPRAGGGTADMVATRERVWVATRDRRVLALEHRRGRQRGAPVPLTLTPSAIAARGDDVWVGLESGDGTAQMIRIDARTRDIAATVPVAPHIQGVAYTGGRLWTLHGEPNHLVARDPTTLQLLRYVALPGTTAGALASGAGALWATLPDEDQLVRYQPDTGNRANVSVGGRPIGVAVHGDDVWVAANGASTVERVAAQSLRHAGAPIRVPLNPLAIAVTQDAIWVTCVGENVIARVAPPT